MPPTTRSHSNTPTKPRSKPTTRSAAATPTRRSNSSSNSNTPNTTPNTTTRKIPHCSQCGRPRVGHPRSGCPFTATVSDDGDGDGDGDGTDANGNGYYESDSNGEGTDPERGDVDEAVEALGSMDLEATPNSDSNKTRHGRRSLGIGLNGAQGKHVEFEMEDTKQAIRERRREAKEKETMSIPTTESLASISTSSSEILNMLVFEEDEDNKAGRRLSRRMPGMMISPYDGFVSTQTLPETKEEETQEGLSQGEEELYTRPLGKTLSMEEREMFIEDLEALSGDRARFYMLTDRDVLTMQGRTPKRGMYTRIVDFGKDKKLMIVGRDGKEVDELYEKVNLKKKGSGFGTGVVFGAAATFGGLAFV